MLAIEVIQNNILTFDNCRLDDSHVLGEVDGGFQVMNEWLYATRLTVAAFCVGRARRVFDASADWAATQSSSVRPSDAFKALALSWRT